MYISLHCVWVITLHVRLSLIAGNTMLRCVSEGSWLSTLFLISQNGIVNGTALFCREYLVLYGHCCMVFSQ